MATKTVDPAFGDPSGKSVDPNFAVGLNDGVGTPPVPPGEKPIDRGPVGGGSGSGAGAGGGHTPGAPAPAPGSTIPLSQQQSAHAIVTSFLQQYGLEALGDWAWNNYKQHQSLDLIKLQIRDQPAYKDRFSGLLQLASKGIAITEQQSIDWERQAQDLMRQAGMPQNFYDKPQDFQQMIGAGWSTAELSGRINDAYTRVAQAPDAVRKTMAEYYGGDGGDRALAAMFLDSSKALPVLKQEAAAAEIGGYLSMNGVKLSRQIAQQAAAFGNSTQANQTAAANVGTMAAAGLFHQTVGEAHGISSDTGVQAAFENDAAAQAAVQGVINERATRTSGSGGAMIEQQGVIGLGSSRP